MTTSRADQFGHWSTHQFTEYVAAVSHPETEPAVLQGGYAGASPTAQHAESTAQRVHLATEEPIRLGPVEVHVRASIGIADDRGGRTAPEAILGLADAAMFRAKRSGAGRTCVHGSTTEPAGLDRSPDTVEHLATGRS